MNKNLVDKWAPVLDSDIGELLTNRNKEIISQLLENQSKMNKGYLRESSQLDSSMSHYQQYALSLIRKSYQNLLAMKLCEVSVGTNNTGTYYLKRVINNKLSMTNNVIMLNTHRIRSHYTTELQLDLKAMMGVDVEALMLEALAYEHDQYLDRQLINSMVRCATNIELGGIEYRGEDLSFGGMDGDTEYIYERIIGRIASDAFEIGNLTGIGPGNFMVCSHDILSIITKSNKFKPNIKHVNNNVNEAGTLITDIGEILVILDHISPSSYILIGLHGEEPGESGIAFIPSIPYNFTKQYSPEVDSEKITVNSVWALADNTLGSGCFYRHTEYVRVKQALEKMN